MADAYTDALRMLARRELSEAQLRQRLERRGYSSDEIDRAADRLRAERALDDVRVAEAIARTQTSVKRRGKIRVRQQIQQAGIAAAIANHVVNDVFDAVDQGALLEASLAKRLRPGRRITTDA